MEQTDSHRRRYEVWVRTFAQPLYRYAYRLTGNAQIAEDLLQETFMEAWRSIANQKGDDRARGWLFQILRFRYAHFVRDSSRRLGTAPPGEAPQLDRPGMGRPALDRLADQDALQAALNELSPAIRETFLMVFAQECTCRETAQNLNIPLGTVLSRLDSARRRLRTVMDQAADGRRPMEGGNS